MNLRFPIALSVDQLMAKSREITGIEIVDHEIIEPLSILHRAYSEESCLSEEGANAKQKKLLRLLANRLRMQRDFAAHPEIADEPIVAPVIVMGMARSGTTKTQKALAASGDFNYVKFWMAHNPALVTGSREESPQPRIDDADDFCRWFDQRSPESRAGHPFETQEPEEDSMLTEGCFRTITFFGFAEIPSFLQWMSTQDPTVMFKFLRDAMKYLQWQGLASRDKRWLLKAPIYYGLEPQLLSVFPDAKLVMTHRTPLQTLPSAFKLLQGFHRPFDASSPHYPMLLGAFAAQMRLHLQLRAADTFEILDLRFEDTTRDMASVIRRIYAWSGMPLTANAVDRIRQWEAGNPMHAKGVFRYSLAEFGLTEEAIREGFGGYLDFVEGLARDQRRPAATTV